MPLMLECRGLSFHYAAEPGRPVLQDLDFSLQTGEIVALLGPSGCGKTTLMRIFAGLETVNGDVARLQRPARTGVAFQEPRLFPWRTVEQNLRLALSSLPRTQQNAIYKDIAPLLDRLGIGDCAQRYPDELSGGMRQRVGLARALLFGTELQLWDEPFQSLDANLRRDLARWVRARWKQAGTSAIVVSHDAAEVLCLADRICIMNNQNGNSKLYIYEGCTALDPLADPDGFARARSALEHYLHDSGINTQGVANT